MAKKKKSNDRASHDREMQETNQTSVARKGKSQDRASGTVHPQSSRLSLDRHISNESSHDNEMQETYQRDDLIEPSHDDLIEPSHDNEMEDMPLETEPSNGEGGGYSTKDVYPSDDQDCNKRICLEREEEHEKLKEEVKDLKSVLYELKDLVQSTRENNSNTYPRSRQSAPMDNVESCSDADLEDE
ncbi:hypothetical protein L3X38_012144 [Prunus dulcis]|uniref:Uncharacterized protein n=1 Tax=Prunus dulcis TaxID=3755 RepID=A0AAD4WLK0_PRUDU|nr:hypothetical protein L3X38_012144 [Prunus dulcis]